MKFLFILNRMAHVRHFDRAVRILADRGHEICLATQDDELELPRLLARHPRITSIAAARNRGDDWTAAATMLRRTRDWTPYDRQLSATMMADLIGFAWNGRPGPDWPAWSVGDERERVFGDNITVRPLDRMRLDWLEAHPVARTAPAPRPISPRD